MTAVRKLGADQQPTIASIKTPEPSAVTALVRIKAAAINASDVLNAQGSFPHTAFPITLGRDYAGIVEAGPSAWIGTEVYGTSGKTLSFEQDGTHAECCRIPISCLTPKPKNLTFQQAASVGVPFTTAALALQRAAPVPTDVVMVVGASGIVGSALCQLASAKGCRVLKAARRGQVDVNLASDPDMAAAKDLTNGRGPDIIIDTTGVLEVAAAALRCLAPGGRFSFISAPRKGSTNLTFDMHHVYRQQKAIIGSNSVLQSLEETAATLAELTPLFEQGILQAPSERYTQIPLHEAVGAYQALGANGREKYMISL